MKADTYFPISNCRLVIWKWNYLLYIIIFSIFMKPKVNALCITMICTLQNHLGKTIRKSLMEPWIVHLWQSPVHLTGEEHFWLWAVMMAELLYGIFWPVALPRSSVPMSIQCALSGQVWYKHESCSKCNDFLPVTFHILGKKVFVKIPGLCFILQLGREPVSHPTYFCDLIFIAVGQGLATNLWAYLPTIMCAFGMCWMENATSNIGFLHQLWKLVMRCCMC